MMRINRRTDYAIRVMLALAKQPGGSLLQAPKIQKSMLVPRAFLFRIIADLSKARLVNTYPGPKGGVQLSKNADQINLKEVWEAIEGPFVISDCLETPQNCPLNGGCPVHAHWNKLQKAFVNELESITLNSLATEAFRIAAAVG